MPGFEVFGKEEEQEIQDVLKTGVLFRYEFAAERQGVYKVRTFEEKFAAFCGASFAQAVTSGTAALKVALAALGVGPGDEVITQAFTFVATWEAILEVGATPVFAEVDATMNMDPANLETKISANTRCIIPVHMLGAQARIEEIVAIAQKYGIPVLEDTAQSAGGRYKGQHLGTFGACGTFSFDSVKTMTTGEGGMIITNDGELWRGMSEYHDHGHDHQANPGGRGGEKRRFVGSNYRMMEIQGAIGLAQLAKLDSVIIAGQKKNKAAFKEAAAVLPGVQFREIIDQDGDSATHLCFFLDSVEHCQRVNEVLAANGCAATYFGANSWHYYPRWEHLLDGKTISREGWPLTARGKRRFVYDPAALPQSAGFIERCLGFQIPVRMSDERLGQMRAALQQAARA
ncbi:MAG: DegT/DnrJ/EryC1/StrS family aminotransferase [Desulfobulbaceae bacterium]|nr:DegT/DnrJ/EryC1/StrS family aminotransferase [Desulfobulbaceae bacterium]